MDTLNPFVHVLFTSPNNRFSIGEEAIERKLSEIHNKKGEIVGYSMLLEDDTEQQKYVKLLNTYNSRLQSEVEEKTEMTVSAEAEPVCLIRPIRIAQITPNTSMLTRSFPMPRIMPRPMPVSALCPSASEKNAIC